MMQPQEKFHAADVLIVGASVRAAVQSAVWAGFRPWAVDLFGDADTRESAAIYRKISEYRELPAAVADWPRMPWLGTGAVENHPQLIERLSQARPHWGHSAQVIRNVRDPHRLQQVLRESDFPALAIWPDNTPPPPDGRWMLKPIRSAGGQGVFAWDQNSLRLPEVRASLRKPHVFQERASGPVLSALFLSSANHISLAGCCRLLRGTNPLNPFGFGGAIGPIPLPAELERRIGNIGRVLAERFALRGLWGMDFVLEDSSLRVTEINPRYTASVEVYEHAYGISLLTWQQVVFEGGGAIDNLSSQFPLTLTLSPKGRGDKNEDLALSPKGRGDQTTDRHQAPIISTTVGKAVVYADGDLVVPNWGEWIRLRDSLRAKLPVLADRPAAGSLIPQGHPVCTLLAAGTSESDCRSRLHGRLQELQTHFQRAGQTVSIPPLESL